MRIAICDDEQYFVDELRAMLGRCDALKGDVRACGYTSGADLVAGYVRPRQYDMVFLDVEMPGMSGIEAGQMIRCVDGDVVIVFLTAHRSYAYDAFGIGAFDYLLKPLDLKDLNHLLVRSLGKIRGQRHIVELKWQGSLHVLEVGEIEYVEGISRRSVFHCVSGERHECADRLSAFTPKLTPYGFALCHQGFLVNMRHIADIGADAVHMTTGAVVPVSRGKKKSFKESFNDYMARYRL